MPVHDTTASTLSLARVVLQGVDRTKQEVVVATPTLVLLLETLIALGAPGAAQPVQESSAKNVRTMMTTFEAMTEHRGA